MTSKHDKITERKKSKSTELKSELKSDSDDSWVDQQPSETEELDSLMKQYEDNAAETKVFKSEDFSTDVLDDADGGVVTDRDEHGKEPVAEGVGATDFESDLAELVGADKDAKTMFRLLQHLTSSMASAATMAAA
jgi:molecular chaperone GrpE (heat shock protein)